MIYVVHSDDIAPEDDYIVAVLEGPDDVDPTPILHAAKERADQAMRDWQELRKRTNLYPKPPLGMSLVKWWKSPAYKEAAAKDFAWMNANPMPDREPYEIFKEAFPELEALGFREVPIKNVYIREYRD